MPASSSLSDADAAKDITNDEYPSLDPSSPDSAIPVIDLASADAPQLIGHACRTWGAFQVTNHGIPDKVVDDMEFAVRSLFCLPTQQKLKAARSPNGMSGYGVHNLNADLQKLPCSESFTVAGSPLEQFRQLWPHDYTKFCCIFEEYEKEIKRLSGRLMLLMLDSLGLTKEDAKWADPKGGVEDAPNALQFFQLNSYPACSDPNRVVGLAQHTDPSIFNILHQSNTSGLQVLKEGIGWLTIPPIPGALVVSLGDLLQLLTNGLYPSVIHRAMVHRTQHRLSIAYLYAPPDSAQIAPLPKLVSPSHPPLYSPITWVEYLIMWAKLKDQALSSLRLSAPPN